MTIFTSTELNYIVFRYLQESGFVHTAFILGFEASIDKDKSTDVNSVPYGALITLAQKGLQYLEMEANLKNDDTDETVDYSFIKPFDLLTKNADELKQLVEERKRKSRGKEKVEETEIVIQDKQKGKKHENVTYKLKKSVTFGGAERMDMSTSLTPRFRGVRSSDVLTLTGHSEEVHTCAWSPTGLLASGSGDSTARIWSIAEKSDPSSVINRLAGMRVLYHSKAKPKEKRKDALTLDWNADGTLLATGSRDGLARVWNTDGVMQCTLNKHKGSLYSVKWNKRGDYLLTGSFDGTAIVWDVFAKQWIQQFEFQKGAILDVDWRTNRSFASASSNTMVYVCKTGQSQPMRVFAGHKDEVNCVKWESSGELLASCSDDKTAKIWSMNQDVPLHDFKGHAKEVYLVRWSIAESTTKHPNNPLLLATASFDSTVKLWDVEAGSLYHSLNDHRDAVCTMEFSPNGEYLASGSVDKLVIIWSVREGKIIKTFFGNGNITQVSWNKEGNKIAYSTNNNSVCVSDFRK